MRTSLNVLESLLDEARDRMFDPDYLETVERELRRLYARIRVHHAADQLVAAPTGTDVPPELAKEGHRLLSEHSFMSEELNRLIRAVGSMADRSLEDKEVFSLQVRELIAFLRRHEAEEDRLFYLAVWCNPGAES